MLSLLASILLFAQALAQDSSCDFYQYVNPSEMYTIRSPNYPYSYQRNQKCRWIGECPSGYLCRLDCYLEMPLTSGCSGDQVLISRTGDAQLSNAERYCGRQTLSVLSVNTKIALASITTATTSGGRFACNLTAQAAPPPPCRCGVRKQERIVGGSATGMHEFTMAAGLMEKNTELLLCGAMILSERFILTAAHCLYRQTPGNIRVSVGDRNLTQGIMFNVVSFRIHPNYNSNNYDYDAAILTLDRNITMTENISPCCLPFKYRDANVTGASVALLGWGTTSFGGPTSSILLKTDVTIISQAECQSSSDSTVTDRQVCTRTPGKDSCQNDSGGSGQYTDPRTGRLFAFLIISSGVGCGSNTPAINTRLTSTEILRWIVNNAPANYCAVQ